MIGRVAGCGVMGRVAGYGVIGRVAGCGVMGMVAGCGVMGRVAGCGVMGRVAGCGVMVRSGSEYWWVTMEVLTGNPAGQCPHCELFDLHRLTTRQALADFLATL